tara:strand:+ start:139 stop:615 length:477 start_codon:yes stop_codon:yes gene_type:complete
VVKKYFFLLAGILSGFLIISAIKRKKSILFMGGLENSISLDNQVKKFKTFNDAPLIIHSHTEIKKLKNNIKNNPNSKVVLFSAGGKFANEIVDLVNNPNQIFVIEPYTCGRNITNKIPKNNIFGGSNCETGNNVTGVFRSDYGGKSHSDSLIEIGKRL